LWLVAARQGDASLLVGQLGGEVHQVDRWRVRWPNAPSDSTRTTRSSSRPAFHTTISSPGGIFEEGVSDGSLSDCPAVGLDSLSGWLEEGLQPTLQQRSAMAAHRPAVVPGEPARGIITVPSPETDACRTFEDKHRPGDEQGLAGRSVAREAIGRSSSAAADLRGPRRLRLRPVDGDPQVDLGLGHPAHPGLGHRDSTEWLGFSVRVREAVLRVVGSLGLVYGDAQQGVTRWH
jgi:hypothetical protein